MARLHINPRLTREGRQVAEEVFAAILPVLLVLVIFLVRGDDWWTRTVDLLASGVFLIPAAMLATRAAGRTERADMSRLWSVIAHKTYLFVSFASIVVFAMATVRTDEGESRSVLAWTCGVLFAVSIVASCLAPTSRREQ
jgi:hypothetical protein